MRTNVSPLARKSKSRSSSLNVHLDAMTKRTSGLYVQDLTTGTGTPALRGRTAVVRYTGWLPSGQQFDSGDISVTGNPPYSGWITPPMSPMS